MAPSALAPIPRAPRVPAALLTACRDLAERYRGTYSPETVLRVVHETYGLFESVAAPGPDTVRHVALFAGDWLADAAVVRMYDRLPPPRVLFVCSHGTGRARMAATLLRRRAEERGSAVRAEHASQHLDAPLDDFVRSADVVVTLGCGDICPVYPGRRYFDWPIPTPAPTSIPALRLVRDRIAKHVDGMLAELAAYPGRDGYSQSRSDQHSHSQHSHSQHSHSQHSHSRDGYGEPPDPSRLSMN